MLFTSQAESLVAESMTEARKRAWANYCSQVAALWAYYHGDYSTRATALLQRYYGQSYTKSASTILRDYLPLVRRLTDIQATCFALSPLLDLRDRRTGASLPPDDQRRAGLRALRDDTNLLDILSYHERMTCLFRSQFLALSWREGEIEFESLAPDQVDVQEHAQSPARVDWAPAIFIGNVANRALFRTEVDSLRESISAMWRAMPDSYTVWQRSHDDLRRPADYGSFQVDASGKFLPNPLFPDNRNTYGAHPIDVWYEFPSAGSVYQQPDDCLLQLQDTANVRFTLFQEAMSFHALGKFIANSELLPQAGELPAGLRDVWVIDSAQPAASAVAYIQGAAGMPGLWTILHEWIQQHCVLRGLPSTAVDLRTPSIDTGEAVRARAGVLRDLRLARGPIMRRALERSFDRMIRPCWDHWHRSDGLAFGPDVRLSVQLADQDDAGGHQSEAQAIQILTDLGTLDVVDVVLRRWTGEDPRQATPEQRQAAVTYVQDAARRRALLAAMRAEQEILATDKANTRISAAGGGTPTTGPPGPGGE